MLKVPLTKVEKSMKTALFFILLLLLVIGGSILFIYPMMKEFKMYYIIGSGAAGGLLMLAFLLATFLDPGYLKTDKSINFQELLDITDPYNICPD